MKTFFTRQGLLGHAVGQVARPWELAVLRSGGTGGQRHAWALLASSKSAPRCYALNHALRVRGYFPKSPQKQKLWFFEGCTGFHRLQGAEDALAVVPQAAAVTCRPGGCQQPRAPAGWRAGTPIMLVLHMCWKPQQQTCFWEDSFPRQSALVPHEITAAFAQEQTQVSTFSTMLHGNFPHPAYI